MLIGFLDQLAQTGRCRRDDIRPRWEGAARCEGAVSEAGSGRGGLGEICGEKEWCRLKTE